GARESDDVAPGAGSEPNLASHWYLSHQVGLSELLLSAAAGSETARRKPRKTKNLFMGPPNRLGSYFASPLPIASGDEVSSDSHLFLDVRQLPLRDPSQQDRHRRRRREPDREERPFPGTPLPTLPDRPARRAQVDVEDRRRQHRRPARRDVGPEFDRRQPVEIVRQGERHQRREPQEGHDLPAFLPDRAVDRLEPSVLLRHPFDRSAGEAPREEDRQRRRGRGGDRDENGPPSEPEEKPRAESQNDPRHEEHGGGDIDDSIENHPRRPHPLDPP